MPRPARLRPAPLIASGIVLLATAAAAADRPGRDAGPLVPHRDGRRAGPVMYEAWPPGPPAHARPTNGGPGYVGSDFGLGKPAFTGLGTRPDWGRSD